ncbi:unnamed protein product [Rangifer tarandus platyrhynchus]|uniref:Uncharacterized protein n=1 Tax=Rangifer tarandus platyrhynchus TaxID=3082113 RepID=A0ABN8XXA5_RANTA|nr:unnamed protein product [Rangifer tarandus platyrhynchus]
MLPLRSSCPEISSSLERTSEPSRFPPVPYWTCDPSPAEESLPGAFQGSHSFSENLPSRTALRETHLSQGSWNNFVQKLEVNFHRPIMWETLRELGR